MINKREKNERKAMNRSKKKKMNEETQPQPRAAPTKLGEVTHRVESP